MEIAALYSFHLYSLDFSDEEYRKIKSGRVFLKKKDSGIELFVAL